MPQTEIIRLDAVVRSVIAQSVFRAELANGHRIVAFAAGKDGERVRDLAPGAQVSVEMSPYDMSKGRIVALEES
jgi:translation initiation factor IF-1